MSASDTRPLIVGLGCRVPGARGPGAMWDILADGRCVIGEADRRLFDPAFYFDSHRPRRGRTYSFRTGQIDDLYAFDPGFFGISPRTAVEMDPQQRLMLQTVWEAVEDAGLDITDLAGDRTGVMVGSSYLEMLPKYYLDPARGGSTFILGNTLSVIANRVSSTFDFGGPSYAVDTACSSALYALHQGAEAIRRGDLDTAIIGGVHVVRTPGGFVGFSQARMLSPTGLCRAFDAAADGYVRSEACISVVLMHPEKAAALQPRVRAKLLANGVNSDGKVSPLTVPAAARQAALLREVLKRSGQDPDDLHFYEAHGTGTAVGDPIEARGLGDALGKLRRAPLPIGSAKTNFGHSEPASGLVGLAKVLLAMEHRRIPASLHFETGNPDIDFDDLNLEVVSSPTALPEAGPIIAGISSFGFGGTNAAAILSDHAPHEARLMPGIALPKVPWLLLSASSEAALARLKTAWADLLDRTPRSDWPLLAASAARRAAQRHRVSLPLSVEAPAILRGAHGGAVWSAHLPFAGADTVFAFPGNGAQHPTAGREAYRKNATFRAEMDAVAAAFECAGVPDLVQLLEADDLEARCAAPSVAQPILFACQVAQARTLMAAGVRPAMVIGHSLGEIAALHVAGAFGLEDAARIVARRSARFDALRGAGGMVTVAASEADARQLISGVSDDLSIAAINSPNSVTVTGPVALLDRLSNVTLHGKRVPMIRLGVEVPYHSAALDGLEAAFLSDLEDIAFRRLTMPVASSVTGRLLRPGEVDAGYMWRNSREPVRFAAAVQAACGAGPCLMMELAPKPVLAANLRDCARFAGASVDHVAPPLAEASDILAAQCWARGAHVETQGIAGRLDGPGLPLPGYPWDEQDYFAEPSPDGMDFWGEGSSGALAGRQMDKDVPAWVAEFTPTAPTWVADHKVAGKTILPATALLEIALSAAACQWPDRAIEIAEFDILSPAEVEGEGLRIRTTIDAERGQVTLSMRPRLVAAAWQPLARGILRPAARPPTGRLAREPSWPNQLGDTYDLLDRNGLSYGPAFRRLEDVARGRGRHWVCKLTETDPTWRFRLDPMGLDAVFHSLARGLEAEGLTGAGAGVLIPNRVGRLTWSPGDRAIRFARVELVRRRQMSLAVDVTLFDADRRVVATLEGVEFALAALTGASQVMGTDWRRRLPRWRASDAELAWPRGWRSPARVLTRLGLGPEHVPTECDLLLDRLRSDLSSGEDVTDTLATLLRDHPGRIDDARVLMADQRGDEAFALRQTAGSGREMWALAERLVVQIAKGWRPGQRLNVLLVGLADPTVTGRLVGLPGLDDLLLWHPTEAGRAYLQAALPTELQPRLMSEVTSGQADVIVAVGPFAAAAELETLAAPGAMGFGIELAALAGPTPPGAWFTVDGSPGLRLTLRRLGRAPDLSPVTLNTGGVAVPILPEDVLSDEKDALPTHVHLHEPGETASAGLGRLMMALKRFHARMPDRLVLLLLDRGGAQFEALARGAASVLRSLKNEYPDQGATLLAVASPPPAGLWPAILAGCLDEPVLHIDGSDIRTERVEALPPEPPRGASTSLSVGALRGAFIWRGANRQRPKPGEVEVELAATGLNFRDVLWAQGRLPDRLFDLGSSTPGMGMEWAGHVVRTGEGSTLAPGTPVMGFGAQAFRGHLTLPERAVLRVPDGMSLEAAAAVPVAFATAWEALLSVARLTAEDRLLLHGAAGGVGLAALQIAKRAGASVLATAGTEDKRAIVKAMGAAHVFDSRDLSFADHVREATDGHGVSVVLNSLAGMAMHRSLECLAPFGRFVELGKRDFLEGTGLDTRPLLRSLSYHAYDLDQRLTHDPDGVFRTMTAVAEAFAKGELCAPPTTLFEGEAIGDAVRHMQASRHCGKIVVRPPKSGPRGRGRSLMGTWVLIGGNGGVGLSLARALREAGATEVHLLSRSGRPPLGSGPEADWAAADPGVRFHACRAEDATALRETLVGIEQPIEGVVHAAAVLRDRLLKDLDPAETEVVLGAKLGAAEALDEVLTALDLSPRHVLYLSSVAAFLGNPGQIVYAAANAALEAIAEQRRKRGLAGSVLALGAISDRGLLARDPSKSARLASLNGLRFLTVNQAVASILAALRHPEDRDTLHAPLSWRELAPMLPSLQMHGFSRVISEADRRRQLGQDLVKELQALEWPRAVKRAQEVLVEIFAGILRLPAAQFDPRTPVSRSGIDSLMAMELRLEVEQRFGIGLPASVLSETANANDIALSLLRKIRGEDSDD